MKRILIHLFLFFILGSKSFAQVTTPDYAKYYYRMTVQDGSGQVIDHTVSGLLNGRMYTRALTGGTNQQWAVMPTFITAKNGAAVTSQEFVMGSRANGKVVDISDGTTVRCYLPFHGGTNQLFSLYLYSSNIFAVRSPSNTSKVWDKSSNNGNIIKFYAPWHGGGNQKFQISPSNSYSSPFASLRTKNLVAIPFPAAPTSFTQQMPIETPRTFIQETLMPYHFIKNDLPPAQQVEFSPYYKVVHYQYYRAASGNWDVVYLPGFKLEHTIRVKNGVSQSKVTEVTNKMNLSYSSTGEFAAKLGDILSIKTGYTWSAAFERSVKTVTSFTETNEVEETYTKTIDVPTDIRIVTYQLVDYYEMYRANNTTAILTWEVGRNQTAEVNYQGSSSGGRIAGNASTNMRYELKNGKMIPLTDEAPAALTLSEKNIRVSPNPSKGFYRIEGSAAIQPSVSIQVYDQAGKIVYQQQRSNTPIDGMSINLSNLRPGQYVIKLVAGKNIITKWIIKE